ncbi:LysM peptidoglycan-binding domain-containing protein [Kocuria sp. cx-455]|uniref:lytic transglycosylase n=1 Tax=Kocuria sp. cx-455 TaxID=2771377 RepID=UPI001686B31A|nr:LysM peptidoglycan-binding domain-containing protein [Kocuria sp. cx-455]MBD2765615.1 LysM peptidoglycan-binding domain-containing protein [Kocuria sp. cx-455]
MPVEPPEHRPSARSTWARRATKGSAVTALAALSAVGSLGVAHAQSPAPPENKAASQHAHAPGEITVAPGDSVWSLATKHGVTVTDLMKANKIPAHAMVRPGDRLTVPGRPQEHTQDEPAGTTTPQPPSAHHTVAPGDTVWDLADQHGISVAELQRANDLDASSLLRPGRTLTIPGSQAASKAADTAQPPAAASAPEPAPKTKAPEAPKAAPEPAVDNTFAGRTYPRHVVDSANKHHAELQKRDLPSQEAMQSLVRETAESMGVEPTLALAHAAQESGFQQGVVSPADAVGTMQVIPSAGEWASQLVGRDLDLLDARDNVTAGVAIIKELQDKTPSKEMGIAAYYQGLHGVKTYGLFSDTKDYVRAVSAQEKRFD